ncbi:MAG: hypothetical protein AB7T48_05635 [Solirubrobacterales bacterium]
MQRKTTGIAEQRLPAATRIAWWVALLATLALAFTVVFANSAEAMTLSPGSLNAVAFPGEEEEDPAEEDESAEEDEFEECEVVEEEGEEEEFCEEAEVEEATPPECLLSSAEATVVTSPAHDTVRVAIRYTSRSSAAVRIDLKLRGRKGSLNLGGGQERFKRAGVFRETERLTDPQMVKVVAAKSFTVELQALNTPRYCHRYFDRELTVKRASGGGLTWSAPAARSR